MNNLILEKNIKINDLELQVEKLKGIIKQMQRSLFGPKKETILSSNTELLPGFEMPDSILKEESITSEKVVTKKSKRKPFTQFAFPADAPRKEIIFDLPEAEKEGLKYIGDDKVEKLAYKKGNYYVKVCITKKYVAPDDPNLGVISLDPPKPAIPGSRIDESMLSSLVVSKYADHLPLYRLEKIYSRDDLFIKRQTLSKWIMKVGDLLKPLHKLLFKEIMSTKVIFTDDTPVKLQQKGKGKTKTARMWIFVGGSGGDPPLVYYEFTPDRKKIHALNSFNNFTGSFHSDSLAVYEEIAKRSGVIWQPCWAHARRKFYDALTAHPIKDKILKLIDKLFLLEREAWAIDNKNELSSSEKLDERLIFRKRHSSKIVNEIFTQLRTEVETGYHLPKGKLHEAIFYLLKRQKYFENFILHPELRMDNNVSERNIRPIAIGRKNWLFVGSENGGEAAATILSLIQTCKNLKINPHAYLEDVLRRINNTDEQKIHQLLPQNWGK